MIMTENELLQEVLTELAGPIDPKTEICAPMLVDNGMSENQAYRTLNERKKRGELTWRWVMYRGQRVKAYRKV